MFVIVVPFCWFLFAAVYVLPVVFTCADYVELVVRAAIYGL